MDVTYGRIPTHDGIELDFVRKGKGEEVLVVPSASWLGADLDPLSEQRTVVFYDLRGRGRSTAVHDESLLGLEHDVADLECLRAELGIERMHLLGWSYHGLLTARYALEHTDRVQRLVLVGPSAPKRSPHFEGFLDRFSRRIDLAALENLEAERRGGLARRDPAAFARLVHSLFFHAYVTDSKVLEHMRSDPAVEPNLDAERVNDQGRRTLEALGSYDFSETFEALDVPTLILHGTEDPVPLSGSELWAECLPHARLVELQNVGHMPWLEVPERFFGELESFLGGAQGIRRAA